jgi:hypothetical protein
MARTRYSDLRDTFHVSRITAFLGMRTFQHPAGGFYSRAIIYEALSERARTKNSLEVFYPVAKSN